MSLKVNEVSIPSSINEVLALGKVYFEVIDSVAPYVGSTQCSYDATEVLLLLLGMNGRYIQTHSVADYLCLTESKIKKAVFYLKGKDLIYSNKKGLLVRDPLPIINDVKDPDEKSKLYTNLHSLDEWYSTLSDHWKVMTFIHTVKSCLSLGVADCAKRDLAICLFKGKVEGFTFTKTKQMTHAINNLDYEDLADKYKRDTYKEDTENKWKAQQKYMRSLGHYQKAKMLLINPQLLESKKTYYISKVSKEAVILAIEYFPFSKKESNEEVLRKRNTYIYEYLVRQQITKDNDFNPKSPFYGKPLKERLSLLKNAVLKNDDVYNSGIISQKNLSEVNNATESKNKRPSFIEALRTKIGWDKPKKK